MTTSGVTHEWASAAWREEAEAWVRARLAEQGLRVTGPVEQPRIRVWSTQLTVPTDAGLVWFKENNPGQRAEAAVIAALAEIAPDHVVTPIAIEPERGWLLSPDRGATLASLESTDAATWERVVTQYAELQRRTVDHAGALLAAGLAPLPPSAVPAALVARADELLHTSAGRPLHLDEAAAGRLRAAAAAYARLATELEAAPVPSALEHNDLHHNNTFVPAPGERTLRFFDFGDAVWGHPFVSLFVTLNVVTQEWATTAEDPRVQRLVDAYLECWTDLADRSTLRAVFDLAQHLGPVHRLETWCRLLAHVTDEESVDLPFTPQVWVQETISRAAVLEAGVHLRTP